MGSNLPYGRGTALTLGCSELSLWILSDVVKELSHVMSTDLLFWSAVEAALNPRLVIRKHEDREGRLSPILESVLDSSREPRPRTPCPNSSF